MEIKEAIQYIEFLHDVYQMRVSERTGEGKCTGEELAKAWKPGTPLTGAYKALVEACHLATSALEARVPVEHHHTKVDGKRYSVCPKCLKIIITYADEYPNYCNWCSQKIDWSDLEEGEE